MDCLVKAGEIPWEKMFDMAKGFGDVEIWRFENEIFLFFEFVLQMGGHFGEEFFAELYFGVADFDLGIG